MSKKVFSFQKKKKKKENKAYVVILKLDKVGPKGLIVADKELFTAHLVESFKGESKSRRFLIGCCSGRRPSTVFVS